MGLRTRHDWNIVELHAPAHRLLITVRKLPITVLAVAQKCCMLKVPMKQKFLLPYLTELSK